MQKAERRLSHDRRVFFMALVAGLPAVFVSMFLLWRGDFTPKVQWTLTLVIVGTWLGFGFGLRAMVVRVTPSDPFVETPTGLPSPMTLCWLHYVSGRMNQLMEAVDWERVYEHLPLITMDERAGRRNPHWRANIEHPQLDDYWAPLCYQAKFDQVNVPVLHISGWYDDEHIGTPLNYIGMTTHGATPAARANRAIQRVIPAGRRDAHGIGLDDDDTTQTGWIKRGP